MSIPLNLKMIRRKMGISQEAFGKLFGVSRSAINSYEIGQALPNTQFLLSLASLVNIAIEKILYVELREEDLPETINSDQVQDPKELYQQMRNLYDIRDLVEAVKDLQERVKKLEDK